MRAGTIMSDREAELHRCVAEDAGDTSSEAGAKRLKKKIEDVYRYRFRCAPPVIEIVEAMVNGVPMFVLRSRVVFKFPARANT